MAKASFTERLKFLFVGEGGERALSGVNTSRGWLSIIGESFMGAWQRNITISRDTVLSFSAVFSCVTLIASDVSKLRMYVAQRAKDGTWQEVAYSAVFSDLLRRPNPYQNWMQFIETWILSKITRGNTYILKIRNRKGRVVRLYVMDPDRTSVLVSDAGEVFYRFMQDNLSEVDSSGLTVPASEVIHDRYNCFFHPLCGLPPLYASGLPATQGIEMQTASAKFFKNQARPSGMLTANGAISNETAERLKAAFEANYTGDNIGKLAVAGDGLKFEKITMTADETQMVEQLKLSADMVCATYHVPKYKVMGEAPNYNNVESLDQQYYSQCLQPYIEAIEVLLDEGLNVPDNQWLTFDLDMLLRMDSKTQMDVITSGVKGKVMSPNDGRKKLNLKSMPGGDNVFLQEQDYPMKLLADRAPPADKSTPAAAAPATPATPPPAPAAKSVEEQEVELTELFNLIKQEVSHEIA